MSSNLRLAQLVDAFAYDASSGAVDRLLPEFVNIEIGTGAPTSSADDGELYYDSQGRGFFIRSGGVWQIVNTAAVDVSFNETSRVLTVTIDNQTGSVTIPTGTSSVSLSFDNNTRTLTSQVDGQTDSVVIPGAAVTSVDTEFNAATRVLTTTVDGQTDTTTITPSTDSVSAVFDANTRDLTVSVDGSDGSVNIPQAPTSVSATFDMNTRGLEVDVNGVTATASIPAAAFNNETVIENWASSNTYVANQVVIHLGNIYRTPTDITTPSSVPPSANITPWELVVEGGEQNFHSAVNEAARLALTHPIIQDSDVVYQVSGNSFWVASNVSSTSPTPTWTQIALVDPTTVNATFDDASRNLTIQVDNASSVVNLPQASTAGPSDAVLPTWSSAATYEAGQLVLYRGNVYRTPGAIGNPSTVTPTNAITPWVLVVEGGEQQFHSTADAAERTALQFPVVRDGDLVFQRDTSTFYTASNVTDLSPAAVWTEVSVLDTPIVDVSFDDASRDLTVSVDGVADSVNVPVRTPTVTTNFVDATQTLELTVDGVMSSVTIDSASDAELAAETAARIAGDNTQATNLADETNNRQIADNTLTTNLATEVSDRTSADTTLTNNLNQEIADRTAADTTLTTNLATEVTARTTGDQTLTDNLNAEITARTAGDTARNIGDISENPNGSFTVTKIVGDDLTITPGTGGGGGGGTGQGFGLVDTLSSTAVPGTHERLNGTGRGYFRGNNAWTQVDGQQSSRLVGDFRLENTNGLTPIDPWIWDANPTYFIIGEFE